MKATSVIAVIEASHVLKERGNNEKHYANLRVCD